MMRYNYEAIEESLLNRIEKDNKLSLKKILAIVELGSIAAVKSNMIWFKLYNLSLWLLDH